MRSPKNVCAKAVAQLLGCGVQCQCIGGYICAHKETNTLNGRQDVAELGGGGFRGEGEREARAPMMRSCGCRSAVYTAKLAGEPDSGCTLTPHTAGSRLNAASARAWHGRTADTERT